MKVLELFIAVVEAPWENLESLTVYLWQPAVRGVSATPWESLAQ